MFLSISFGFRIIFAVYYGYQITLGLGLIIWLGSVFGHVTVTKQNLRNSFRGLRPFLVVLMLLIYPIGIWTIQSELERTITDT
jgi:hypothetical protein